MPALADYEAHDALGLAALIRRREVSAAEVLEAAIERVEARNPRLNAVVHTFFDEARAVAATLARETPASPLAGVPFMLKDLGVQVHGQRVTNGSRYWRDQICTKDSTIVQRYRAAGLVLMGMTSTAEYGLSCDTTPSLQGPTVNPWNPQRSPGGSSGGAAVAVASGMLPAAHATDGGGSIRIPSSCNGVFGLEPSRGRNPIGPDVGEGWNGLSAQHVITRTVRDSAAFLDATHGAEPGDPYAAPPSRGSFLDGIAQPGSRLRIAFQRIDHFGNPLHPATDSAVREAATLLADLGHHVSEARPSFDAQALKWDMFTIVGCNWLHALHQRAQVLGRAPTTDDMEPVSWLWAERCRGKTGQDMAKAVGTIHATARALGRFFVRHDVLLTPTCATPPMPTRHVDMASADLDDYYERLWGNNTFTTLYNCTGVPAASVPLCWADDGLPIGIQIAAPLGEELRLLQLARELEQARPWAGRRPRLRGERGRLDSAAST
jgi:amidase